MKAGIVRSDWLDLMMHYDIIIHFGLIINLVIIQHLKEGGIKEIIKIN